MTVHRPSRPAGRDAGQATVELVLVLPVVVLAMLLVLQVGLIARDQVLVVNAAREGARAAAVSGPSAAGPAARASPGLRPERVSVAVDLPSGDLVRVRVRYRAPTDVALIGVLLADPVLTAEVAMRREEPP